MSPSSRLFARLLCQFVVALSVVMIGSQCAKGDAKPERVSESFNRLRPSVAKAGLHESRAASTVELVGCWLKFTHPEIPTGWNSIVETLEVVPDACRQFVTSQESWLTEILTASVEGVRITSEQLVTPWWLDELGTTKAAPDGAAMVKGDGQASYWVYYQDCDRWGVDLTRTIEIELPQPAFTFCNSDVRNESREQTEVAILHEESNEKPSNGRLTSAMEHASWWLTRALRQLEFATVESDVSSGQRGWEKPQSELY